MILSCSEFLSYCVPIVYAHRRGEEWLYIGYSATGIGRVTRGQIRNRVQEGDSIEIWRFETAQEAWEYEQKLIALHQPKFNVFGKEHKAPAQFPQQRKRSGKPESLRPSRRGGPKLTSIPPAGSK